MSGSADKNLRDQRFSIFVRAAVRVQDHVFSAAIRDLSRQGMMLCGPIGELPRVQAGASVAVSCQLRGAEPLRVECDIVWVEVRPDRHGEDSTMFGLRFRPSDTKALAIVDEFIVHHQEIVLVVDDEVENCEVTKRILRRHYEVLTATSGREALALYEENEVAVVLTDHMMPDMDGRALLKALQDRFPGSHTVKIVMSAQTDTMAMQAYINAAKIFYFVLKPVNPQDLLAVVGSAMQKYHQESGEQTGPGQRFDAERARRTEKILEVARRMSLQRDLATAGRLVVEAIEEFVETNRAYYYIYDPISETLWAQSGEAGVGHHRSAVAGLAGFVARTGASLQVDRASDDSRYRSDVDDPTGVGDEHLLIEPILTSDRRALAVLIAVRDASRNGFGHDEVETLRLIAAQCASTFGQMTLQAQIEEVFALQDATRSKKESLFRREALSAYEQSGGSKKPLRISPVWVRYGYYLLLAAFAAGLSFIAFGTIDEYASGPAIVRVDGRSDMTASAAAIVSSVMVQPGQRVAAKQLLVRLYDAQEAAELERARKEFDLQLIKSLRNPEDPQPKEALARLRAERDLAAARLEERSIRAPHAGIVNDLRIRAGEHLPLGAPILSVTRPDATLSIVAMLPGHSRPMLHTGQALRLEVSGFRYAYRELVVDTIGDEVVGPDEAKRFLGQEVASSVTLTGPVILVKAKLPSHTFVSDGRVFNYHDGMLGTADVRLRSEPIALVLVPALRSVFGGRHE